jgi:hypothetical protein
MLLLRSASSPLFFFIEFAGVPNVAGSARGSLGAPKWYRAAAETCRHYCMQPLRIRLYRGAAAWVIALNTSARFRRLLIIIVIIIIQFVPESQRISIHSRIWRRYYSLLPACRFELLKKKDALLTNCCGIFRSKLGVCRELLKK